MERLDYPLSHEWHVSINKHSDETRKSGGDYPSYMYEAKNLADEVPRMAMLFERERKNSLPEMHKQCSQQEAVPVTDNHLKCCLGVKCKECPALIALNKIERCTPEDSDIAKAWTCAAHIVSSGGDVAREGYLMTVGDRMYWDNVYQSLSQSDDQ
jgi:hypothetical protein